MSEKRVLESKVDPNEFKDIILNSDEIPFSLIEGETVARNYYGDTMMDNCKYVFRNKRLEIGISSSGKLVYDGMLTNFVNNKLAQYYEERLKRRGFNVQKRKEGNRIIMEIKR